MELVLYDMSIIPELKIRKTALTRDSPWRPVD